MPSFHHFIPVLLCGNFRPGQSAVNVRLCSGAYISSTSNACPLSFVHREGAGENALAKKYLWLDKFIFGQAIFIGVTKSIALTCCSAIA
jgi:hypothetical protein